MAFLREGEHTERWVLPTKGNASLIESETWDIFNKGFRLMRFIGDRTQVISHVLTTVELFIPALLEPGIPVKTQLLNHHFLSQYSLIDIELRKNNTVIAIDESQIKSGDFLGVIRLDGLDPMLAWGMGSHTGHTTVALWVDGQLYICESTTSSNYWPVNGIQMTPYRQWLEFAHKADYNVVHLPLNQEYSSRFNETSAYEWFKTVEGLPYGYNNMLMTWIDLPEDNYPCLPDGNFTEVCLKSVHVEVLAGIVSKIDAAVADLMFNLALNKRLWSLNGTFEGLNLPFAEVIYQAAVNNEKSLNFSDLLNMPDSQFCQLMGNYRMTMPGYNSKATFAHMAENCPSKNPYYEKPADC